MNPVERGSDLFNFDKLFQDMARDEQLVSAALEKKDATEVTELLDKRCYFLDTRLIAMLWDRFPHLAIQYLDMYPQFARHCPHSLLVAQQKNITLLTKLFAYGLEITEQEYVAFGIQYPETVAKVLQQLPHFARECPSTVYEKLEQWPQTEPVRKVVVKAGAKVQREDLEDQDLPEDLVSSFKRTRVEEESDDELPDIQGANNE